MIVGTNLRVVVPSLNMYECLAQLSRYPRVGDGQTVPAQHLKEGEDGPDDAIPNAANTCTLETPGLKNSTFVNVSSSFSLVWQLDGCPWERRFAHGKLGDRQVEELCVMS